MGERAARDGQDGGPSVGSNCRQGRRPILPLEYLWLFVRSQIWPFSAPFALAQGVPSSKVVGSSTSWPNGSQSIGDGSGATNANQPSFTAPRPESLNNTKRAYSVGTPACPANTRSSPRSPWWSSQCCPNLGTGPPLRYGKHPPGIPLGR